MNAICPRCGTVSLAGSQTTRFTCKTCHLRFCNECQHWKIDRKQKYCARCGAWFSVPPPVIPLRVSSLIIYIPIAAALVITAFVVPLRFWHMALIATLPPVIFSSVYLALFYRRTSLAVATRREAILLARRAISLATIIYVVLELGNSTALTIGVIIAVGLIVVGLAVQRMNPAVIEELRNNRSTWGMVLSMSNWDALLMRFPDMRQAKASG